MSRFNNQAMYKYIHKYMMEKITSPPRIMYIDATSSDSEIARFLNDSVPVRTKAFLKLYVDKLAVTQNKFFILRPTGTGEETTYDYEGQYMP